LWWVYLLLNGIPLLAIIMGLFFYRLFSSHILLYFSRKYFSKLKFNNQAFLSILVQSLFLISFLFATKSILFFSITILLSCLSEVLYWPLRNNIQRLSVDHWKLWSNVALTKNAKSVAIIFWFFISWIWLYFEPLITLLIGSIWILFSYMPLKNISIQNLWRWNSKFIERFFNIKNKIKIFKEHIHITNYLFIYLFISLIAELISWIIPLLVVYYWATIMELWFILVFVQILSIFFHYTIWKLEDLNIKNILNYSILLLLIVFLFFAFLDNTYLSILLVLYTLFWIWVEIWITSKAQKIIKTSFSEYDWGYVLVWVGNLGRSFILPIILILYFFKDIISFHTLILLYWFIILLLIYIFNKK